MCFYINSNILINTSVTLVFISIKMGIVSNPYDFNIDKNINIYSEIKRKILYTVEYKFQSGHRDSNRYYYGYISRNYASEPFGDLISYKSDIPLTLLFDEICLNHPYVVDMFVIGFKENTLLGKTCDIYINGEYIITRECLLFKTDNTYRLTMTINEERDLFLKIKPYYVNRETITNKLVIYE